MFTFDYFLIDKRTKTDHNELFSVNHAIDSSENCQGENFRCERMNRLFVMGM